MHPFKVHVPAPSVEVPGGKEASKGEDLNASWLLLGNWVVIHLFFWLLLPILVAVWPQTLDDIKNLSIQQVADQATCLYISTNAIITKGKKLGIQSRKICVFGQNHRLSVILFLLSFP